MNHTLIQFLIKFTTIGLLINISICSDFELWLTNKKAILKHKIVKISFLSEFNTEHFSNKELCNLILFPSNNVYQIKFLDNIICYDGVKMEQYSLKSNQLFKYKPDKLIEGFISQLILGKFFDKRKYESISDNLYYFKDRTLIKDSILIHTGYVDTIYYKNKRYSYTFYDIHIESLDSVSFNKNLFYNLIDTIGIDVFDFTK